MFVVVKLPFGLLTSVKYCYRLAFLLDAKYDSACVRVALLVVRFRAAGVLPGVDN